MAASSSRKGQAPFLTYLTVFKSRLGIANCVLPLTGFAYQPAAVLPRELRKKLQERVSLAVRDRQNAPVFEYLLEKKLVGSGRRSAGRYRDFLLERKGSAWRATDLAGNELPAVAVFVPDLWLSDPRISSTIGVPTPDNVDEAIELCHQLGLISKAKSTWASAGQLAVGVRSLDASSNNNPMVLGPEAMVLLRQVVEKDGPLLRGLVRALRGMSGPILRDEVALRLPEVAQQALLDAKDLRLAPPVMAEGKRFVALLAKTAEKRASASRAPGVLEHRVSPRLEWLTDLGVLSKDGLPKNGFEYRLTTDAGVLAEALAGFAGDPLWADEAAIRFWRTSARWMNVRARLGSKDTKRALVSGYRLMRRSVGPSAIRDVCFAAALVVDDRDLTAELLAEHLVSWAAQDPGITVSGGRYSRKPELVHVAAEVLSREEAQ